jgi:endonuclease/exonuclease/phosphatase family metal-dependent hydrolase
MSGLEIVSWNIQCGLGVDGRLDLGRIAAGVRQSGAPDIICFQEVARHMPAITARTDVDQAGELTEMFSGYTAVFRPSVDMGRHQFGCMILSRFSVLNVRNHLLPRPVGEAARSMQRQALEVTVDAPGAPLRVTTTHLEFHSPCHRMAQVDRLRELHREYLGQETGHGEGQDPGTSPYSEFPAASDAISCGDYNFLPNSDTHRQILARFSDETPPLLDAWEKRYAKTPHPSTCGLADTAQWPQGPHCRDYFFVSGALGSQIAAIEVDATTRASDHQPMRIAFDRPG